MVLMVNKERIGNSVILGATLRNMQIVNVRNFTITVTFYAPLYYNNKEKTSYAD